MAEEQLAVINGAIISMTVSAQSRITAVTVDTRSATEQVRIWYPEDGGKVQVTVPVGQLLTRSFVGGNQVDRVFTDVVRPGDGATVPTWTSPTWKAWSP